MTTVTKRNLFEEICDGLEAYRDRRGILPRRELSAPDVKAIQERFAMSEADVATSAKKASCRRRPG